MKSIALASLLAIALPLASTTYAQVSNASLTAGTHTAAAQNTRLAALVPAGLSPEEACRGLRDLGACSAVLHVSQNLNIPYLELKYRVLAGQSLPVAIHALVPSVDSRREAARAEKQAAADLAADG